MRINAEGQVTIPADVRERFGLLPQTEIDFVVEGDAVRLVPRLGGGPTKGETLIAHLRGRGDVALSTDEIMALTRAD